MFRFRGSLMGTDVHVPRLALTLRCSPTTARSRMTMFPQFGSLFLIDVLSERLLLNHLLGRNPAIVSQITGGEVLDIW